MQTKLVRALPLMLLFALLSPLALGQTDAGSVAGTVRDNSGAVVSGAQVTVKSAGTGFTRTIQTGNIGQFVVNGLQPGFYDVTVTTSSFAPFKQRVEVTVGGHLTVDARLSVSQSSTTVEVVAEGGAQVNTQNQELSQIITPDQVAQLPSLTRNPYDFVGTAGNVSGGDRTALEGGDQNATNRGVNYAINGQRSSGTEVLLDGVENIDTFIDQVGQNVPIDAVQEIRVITNGFDAQYGRAAGGVVNVTTKSGTNQIHGSAWEFNRLSAYTANTYNNNVNGLKKGKYTRNQFGYTVGGPILKDKLFFFQSTEWLRVRGNAVNNALVPTPALLATTAPNVQAYFNQYGKNNFTYANIIPAGQLGAGFGQVTYSAPTDSGGSSPQNSYKLVGRVDFNASTNTQMFVRYGLESKVYTPGYNFSSPYSQYDVGETDKNNSVLFSLSHVFSDRFFSSSKVSFSRIKSVQSVVDPTVLTTPELILSNSATIANVAVQLPGAFATTTGNGGLPYGGPQNVLQFNEDLSLTKGRHTIRFGGSYNYEQLNKAYGAYAQAIELLGTSVGKGLANLQTGTLANFEAAVNPQGKLPCHTDPVTGKLISDPSCQVTLPVGQPSFARSYRYKDWAGYLQDSWRVTPRFTLNYGARYEYYGVQHDSIPALDSNFYYGTGSFYQRVASGNVQLAPKSTAGGLWNPTYGTIAPRVGFAYDIFGNGSASLRGGFGISYERNFGNVTFNVIQNPPNYAVLQINDGSATVTNSNAGPLGGTGAPLNLPPTSLRHVNQNINTAQTQFYSLALEQQVAHNTVFALEYSGAHGVHLYDIAASNPKGGAQEFLGVPLGTNAAGNPIYTRPNNQYAGINTRGSGGTSRYNALNVRFQSQDLHHTGLSIVTNYTWSHSLDDLSSTFSESSSGSNGVGNLGYLSPTNPKLDWGSSDFDIRHRVTASIVFQTPWQKTGKGFLHQLLGGYTIAPLFSARTGTPYTISDSTNSINAGSGYGVPRYTPSSAITSYSPHDSQDSGKNNFNILTLPVDNSIAFNSVLGKSDFGPFPINMTHRNSFVAPGAYTFDLAASKTFSVTERVKMEFRAEGFNILNHHNLYVNGYNLDQANFTDPVTGNNLPIQVNALKGGLNTIASGGSHDERRFGQFALKVSF